MKKTEWISSNAKDLPEGEVLLFTSSKIITIGDWYKDGWRTHQLIGTNKLSFNEITHWMPLPEPPKV